MRPVFRGIKASISNLPPFVNGFPGLPRDAPIFLKKKEKFAEIRDLKHRLCYTLNRRTPKKRQEMYALSDFLIMVFVMVSEAVT